MWPFSHGQLKMAANIQNRNNPSTWELLQRSEGRWTNSLFCVFLFLSEPAGQPWMKSRKKRVKQLHDESFDLGTKGSTGCLLVLLFERGGLLLACLVVLFVFFKNFVIVLFICGIIRLTIILHCYVLQEGEQKWVCVLGPRAEAVNFSPLQCCEEAFVFVHLPHLHGSDH